MSPTPTLQTIADAAGVSRSTVSLALRNSPALAAATRERIQKIATELGYQPNPMIAALMANLKSGRPGTERGIIAFLTAYVTRDGWQEYPVFRDYFNGASEQAVRLGYRVEPFWLKEPRMTAARMTSVLKARGIVGIIVVPTPTGHGHVSLDFRNFAAVAIGYSTTRPRLHRVSADYFEAIRTAQRQLRHQGYHRIAIILFREQDQRVNHHWSAGYLAFQQNLPAADRLPICWADDTDPATMPAWVKTHRPEAIICSSPIEMIWLQKAKIPRLDKIALVVLTDPQSLPGNLAGIDQHGRLTGAAAVDLIVGQIHRNERGIPKSPRIVLTESTWVPGASASARGGL